MEDAIDPNGLTVKAERPDEVKQAERQEEQLKAMQMEDEEDPRPGVGMDGAGEIPPGKSTNVRSRTNCGIRGSTSMKTPTGNLCSQFFFCFGNN